MSDQETIKVIGRADLGYSPHFRCEIRVGEEYTISPDDYTAELFEPVAGLPRVADISTANGHDLDGGDTDE